MSSKTSSGSNLISSSFLFLDAHQEVVPLRTHFSESLQKSSTIESPVKCVMSVEIFPVRYREFPEALSCRHPVCFLEKMSWKFSGARAENRSVCNLSPKSVENAIKWHFIDDDLCWYSPQSYLIDNWNRALWWLAFTLGAIKILIATEPASILALRLSCAQRVNRFTFNYGFL